MDISQWPMGRIMQMPDHCFGRRWPVGVGITAEAEGTLYDISEAAFPETMVVWDLNFWFGQAGTALCEFSLALGDQLPTTDAEFDALEPLFRDIGVLVYPRRVMVAMAFASMYRIAMRKPVSTGGRRLVGRFVFGAVAGQWANALVIVSSVPKEVPDCLFSV